MRNETIFNRMKKSAFIYFVTEEFITGSSRYVRPHFWKKLRLPSFDVEDEELLIITVMIPGLPERYKKRKLISLMHASIEEKSAYAGSVEVVIQPEVQLMLGQTDAFSPVFWSLSERLLGKLSESIVLLLGDSLFPEEQMQKFDELMQPYLPRINHLTVVYEISGDSDVYEDSVQERNRYVEAAEDYAEDLYYEYGLVAQMQSAKEFILSRNNGIAGQGAAFFLDFGYSGNINPRMFKAGDIYLDIFSSKNKETVFRRKCMEISYISPRKYLDTMVKSGYDKLVTQALRT